MPVYVSKPRVCEKERERVRESEEGILTFPSV